MTGDYETRYNRAWSHMITWEEDGVPPSQVPYMRWQEAFEYRRMVVLSEVLKPILRPSSRVLDLGCGRSIIARISDVLDVPIHLLGIDISQVILDHNGERWPDHKWRKDDATDPQVPGSYYDLVHAGEIIEHVEDRGEVLKTWASLVRRGGYLVVTTPTPSLKVPFGQHIGFVSQGDVKRAMKAEGLTMVATYGIGIFLPLLARTVLAIPHKDMRNRLYRWLLEVTVDHPLLSDQAIYVGRRER